MMHILLTTHLWDMDYLASLYPAVYELLDQAHGQSNDLVNGDVGTLRLIQTIQFHSEDGWLQEFECNTICSLTSHYDQL